MEQKDWLDEIMVEKRNWFYILLSFVFFFITTFLFIFLISKVPTHIKASEREPQIAVSLVITDYVSCFAGVMVSILSIAKREKPALLKIIGTTLNMMTFVFLIGLLFFWKFHSR